jgi:hypothetical protein
VTDPAPSKRFTALKIRIDSLRDTFVPVVDPTTQPFGADYDRVCAFVVLCHAELEEYFESSSIAVLAENHDAWLADSRPRTALMALLSHSPHSVKAPPQEHESGEWFVRSAIRDARERHYRYATIDNHGIDEKYLLALFLPVGIKETDLGAVWLQRVGELARMRGQVAHHSSSGSISAQSPISPNDALVVVQEIVAGLERLDHLIEVLRTEPVLAVVKPAQVRVLP